MVTSLPPTRKTSSLQGEWTPRDTLCSFGSFDKYNTHVYSQDLYRWSFFARGMVFMMGYRSQLLIQRLKRFFLWFFLVLVLSYVFLLLLYLLCSPTSPLSLMPQ